MGAEFSEVFSPLPLTQAAQWPQQQAPGLGRGGSADVPARDPVGGPLFPSGDGGGIFLFILFSSLQ